VDIVACPLGDRRYCGTVYIFHEGMMASNTYVVRLIDCTTPLDAASGSFGKSTIGSTTADISASLMTWYTFVCQKASSQSSSWSADVQWLANPPSSAPGQDAGHPLTINMLLFFVPTPRESVAKLHPRVPASRIAAIEKDAGAMGWTALPSPQLAISEIYVTRCTNFKNDDGLVLKIARTGFHESMHNQLHQGDEMHAGKAGFGAALSTGNKPSAQDTKLMADKIGTLTPQWLDGFQAWRSNATALP
jgi:hypothetical protein